MKQEEQCFQEQAVVLAKFLQTALPLKMMRYKQQGGVLDCDYRRVDELAESMASNVVSLVFLELLSSGQCHR